jgi:hypothetical protein
MSVLKEDLASYQLSLFVSGSSSLVDLASSKAARPCPQSFKGENFDHKPGRN